MNSLFTFRVNVHNIRSFQILSNSAKKTVRYGLKTLSYRSPFLWTNLSQDYKSGTSFHGVKAKKESVMLKLVNVGSASITKET